MERIKQILEKQWRITPIWVKIFAFVGIIWSMIYFISTFLIMTGRAELVMAATGFEVYVLILKGLIGAQFLLFIVHLLILMNQQIGPNLELRQKLNQAQKYLRRIHPVVGITTLIMVLAHVVWNFSRFLSFDWPWTVQI
ncbi:MAG: hypothetical protein ACRCZC_02295, partial [Culicoidibacterales bacterium]